MSNVQEIDTKKVNPHAVALLEELLQLAKRGEIFSIGAAYVLHDCSTGNAFAAKWSPVSLLGEIRCLEHEVLQNHIDTRLHEAGEEF